MREKADEAQNAPVLIALFGQPGAGKSSLVNAIVGQRLAETGVENDVTTERADYEWNGVTLSDLPGYGTRTFPASEYFDRFEILKFDIFLCVVSEKLRDNDIAFFHKLMEQGKKCFIVRNKIDTVFEENVANDALRLRIRANLRHQIDDDVPILLTSCRTKEGLDDLVNMIQGALSGVKRDRFLRSAAVYSKEFLDKKREACRRYALWAAASASLINAVPFPAIGLAADVGGILAAMVKIRIDFGLTKARLDQFVDIMPKFAPLIKNLLAMAAKDGVAFLLKQFAGPAAAAEVTKYVPIVGPFVAGSISFVTIRMVLYSYIDDCYQIAEEMLAAHFR